MKKTVGLTLFLVLALSVGTSSAGEVTLFGPQQYVRTKATRSLWAANSRFFSASPKEGRLVIRNGDENGKHRITSASILLNGKQVLGPRDLDQKVFELETSVDLAQDNHIEVHLKSKHSSYLTVEVKQEAEPPTATIHADSEMIKIGQSATLRWSTTNANSCVINPDVGEVDVNSGQDGIVVWLTETTPYTITATGLGGTAMAEVTIAVIHPPSITLLEPDGLDDTADSSFTIRWDDADADDDATISLYYAGADGRADDVPIVSGLSEDPDGAGADEYAWNTEDVAEGTYYIYAVIDDGVNEPVVNYGSGLVTIAHGPLWLSEFKLAANDLEPADYFGYSVSISGDYAIVGAYRDDDGGESSGSAYIFRLEGGDWIEQAKITASDTAAGDFFGYSVSISGDYAIVGAYGDDDNGSSSGSAYIFGLEDGDWIEQAKITASDTAASDYFGRAVSLSEDYAIVGAYGDDDNGSSSGAAYIFGLEDGDWTQQARITARDAAASDYFGRAVSLSGDYAIVGAYGDDDNGSSSGAAYIFGLEDGDWIQQAKITASDAAASDYFGRAVSISGDHAIVGAYGDDDGGSFSGSAYIFERNDIQWIQQAKITASDAAASDYFGRALSLDGEFAIVGAYLGDNGAGSPSGSVYVFRDDGGQWTEQAKITANDADAHDYFGRSVSVSGEYALIGAHGNDEGGSSSGSAYTYVIQ